MALPNLVNGLTPPVVGVVRPLEAPALGQVDAADVKPVWCWPYLPSLALARPDHFAHYRACLEKKLKVHQGMLSIAESSP